MNAVTIDTDRQLYLPLSVCLSVCMTDKLTALYRISWESAVCEVGC